MTEKRFTLSMIALNNPNAIRDNKETLTQKEVVDLLNELSEENEQLKQYKQAVTDILLNWSQKNLTAKQLQVVIAIMEELGVGIE